MLEKLKDWFGFGGIDKFQSHGGAHGDDHGHGGPGGHTHGVIDPTIASTDRGVWAVKWSFVVLALTSAAQFVVVLISGSVALLADMIHNVGDATTAIPLWIAFALARRKPSKTFTYGLGRVEDLAGLVVVLIILFSAIVAGYEAISRLIHPHPVVQLVWLAMAGLIGFVGNEAVAVFRIKVGREMNSAALIADGYHARTDGLTSLAVVVGALGVWLGFPLADPIIGLLITIAIFGIVWQSARAVLTRMLDGVEPAIVDEIGHAAAHVDGVREVQDVRARWLGHELVAELVVTVEPQVPVAEGRAIADRVDAELRAHIPALRRSLVQVSDGVTGEPALGAGGHHHAPDPFRFAGSLAEGVLAIVDTAEGERFRLDLANPADGLSATVTIDRDGSPELHQLLRLSDRVLQGTSAPAEPHEFSAELVLRRDEREEALPFRMQEPADHH